MLPERPGASGSTGVGADGLVLQQHHRRRRRPVERARGARATRPRSCSAVPDRSRRRAAGRCGGCGARIRRRTRARHDTPRDRAGQLAGAQQAQRHLDVQSRLQARDRVVRAEDPVARDESREAPLVAEHIRQERSVDVHVLAAHPVVGAHHRVRAGVDDRLEMRQVDLVQRVVVDRHVDLEPLVLHRVQREVLDARHHVRAHAPGQRGAHPAREHGVLAVALLRSTPRGMPQQVHADRGGVVRAPAPRSPARSRRRPAPPATGSQVAARAIVTGKAVDAPITTPRAPSLNRMPGMPSRGTAPATNGPPAEQDGDQGQQAPRASRRRAARAARGPSAAR